MVIWQCNACARGQILRGAAPRRSGAVQKWRKATRRALLLWCSQACHELYSQGSNTSRGRAYERASARPGGKGGSAFAPLLEHAVDVRVLCRLRARWRRFDLGGLRRQRARRGRELLRAPAHRPKGEQHRAEGAVHSPSPSAVEASSSPSSCLLRDRRERRRGSGRGRRRGDRHARRPRRLRGLSRRRGNPHARRHRNRAQGARWRRRGRRRGRRRERRGDHRIDRGGSYRGAQPTMLQPRRTRRGGAQPPRERRSRPRTGWTRSAR